MSKKIKIDFVLYDDEYETIVFRFRPRQSSCHSHNDKPPTSWAGVYKVYYSYSVIKKYKNCDRSAMLFNCSCDECSVIDEVAARCAYIAEGKFSIDMVHPVTEEPYTIQMLNNEMHPCGYGVHWDIKHLYENFYSVSMFGWDGVGYRFRISLNKLKEFGKYLNDCCEYMLVHGDPI